MSNSAAEQQAILAAVKQEIAKSLRQGKKKDEIIQRLVARGLNREKAAVLVDQVDLETGADQDDLDRQREDVRRKAIRSMLVGAGLAIFSLAWVLIRQYLGDYPSPRSFYRSSAFFFFGILWFLFGVATLIRSAMMR